MALPPAFSIASWAVLENLCAWMVTAVLISPLLRTLMRPFFLRRRPRATILSRVNSEIFSAAAISATRSRPRTWYPAGKVVGEPRLGQRGGRGHRPPYKPAKEREPGGGPFPFFP